MQLRLHKQVWQDNIYFYKKIRNNCIALSLTYDSILRKPSSNLIYIYVFVAQLVLYYMILYYKIISISIAI